MSIPVRVGCLKLHFYGVPYNICSTCDFVYYANVPDRCVPPLMRLDNVHNKTVSTVYLFCRNVRRMLELQGVKGIFETKTLKELTELETGLQYDISSGNYFPLSRMELLELHYKSMGKIMESILRYTTEGIIVQHEDMKMRKCGPNPQEEFNSMMFDERNEILSEQAKMIAQFEKENKKKERARKRNRNRSRK